MIMIADVFGHEALHCISLALFCDLFLIFFGSKIEFYVTNQYIPLSKSFKA
jgi:hypothetical protein